MDALFTLLWMLASVVGRADQDPACLVLGGLDSVRAAAFVSGDVTRLDEVYVDARAARADVATSSAYRERGLQLRGVRMVRESCRVTSRGADRIRLDVTDRLGATAVRRAGGRWRDLPRDRATRHVVVLRRVGDRWRIESIGPPRPGR